MEINSPNDAALLAALVRNAIAEHTEAGVISTAAILAVVMPRLPNGFSRDDVIALIVRETGTGYAVSFDHEKNSQS